MPSTHNPTHPGVKWLDGDEGRVQKSVKGLPDFLGRLATVDGVLICLILAGLAGLVWFSLRLAAMRIFQVDECTEVNVAWQIVTGQAGATAATSMIGLFHVFLAWLLRNATRAIDLFV